MLCHHRHPDADLLHLLPTFGAIRVSSRSKAAILGGDDSSNVGRELSSLFAYFPIIRLLFAILHDSSSGSF